MVEVPEKKFGDGSFVTAELESKMTSQSAEREGEEIAPAFLTFPQVPSAGGASHGEVCSGLFGSNSTEGEAVIAEVESTIASRSWETEAGEGVVTDAENANLYTCQQNEREYQHRKSVCNICDSPERDGKGCNSYN